MKKIIFLLFVLSSYIVFATENPVNANLNVVATVGPVFSVAMANPETFSVLGSDNKLIPSKEVGSTIVKSNYSSWKIAVDSIYKSSEVYGGLKLDGSETYIPYTFALTDGSSVLVSRFNTPSPGQPITSYDGKSLTLNLYFDHSDETRWPRGIYRDTLVLSITAD
jgi:hypothetical protein